MQWPDQGIRLRKPESIKYYSELLKDEIDYFLFEQYLFAGAVLAISMTLISVCLLICSLEKIFGEGAAQKGAFLLLCLPGALFFFLPGWAPLALLLVSILFYFAGKKIPSSAWRMPESLYSWLIGIAGMLSAAVVLGTVMGNWG